MTREELIERIGEAYETYRRLPDPDRFYRRSMMSSWPLYVRDAVESYGYNQTHVKLAAPSPDAIDRADEVLAWMARYLTNHTMGAKLIWLSYGRGLTMPQCCSIMRKARGFKPRWGFEQRRVALDTLLHCVNGQRRVA